MNHFLRKAPSLPLWLLSSLLFLIGPAAQAQELFCAVKVDASRIQSDRQVFEDLEKNITEYLNFNKWTNDQFLAEERIRCNLQVVVRERRSADYFICEANLQVFRPVYNTTYETVVVNLRDVNFNFRYVAYQNLQFVQNTYTDNLTALLNYYAYLILGFDYGSFALNGGMPFFRQAQEIVNLAASASQEKGWESRESNNRNRYWQVENLLNNSYKGFHQLLYQYHRQGLDQMESDPQKARQAILSSLGQLQRLTQQNPLLLLTKNFLDAKQNELVSAFNNAFVNDKQKFIEIMQDVDPSNMAQYNSVMESR
jgi:hypothetical protein